MRSLVLSPLRLLLCVWDALLRDALARAEFERVAKTRSRVASLTKGRTDSVSSFTREEIDRLRQQAQRTFSVGPLPSRATSLMAERHGPRVYRGSDAPHTVVLSDYVRMNDSTNSRGGAFDLSNLDHSTIERIELPRGAASATHGVNAMAEPQLVM